MKEYLSLSLNGPEWASDVPWSPALPIVFLSTCELDAEVNSHKAFLEEAMLELGFRG